MAEPNSDRPVEELVAGNAYRDSLLSKASRWEHGYVPLWHGWAIMDAFLAGIDYAHSQEALDAAPIRRIRREERNAAIG